MLPTEVYNFASTHLFKTNCTMDEFVGRSQKTK